MVGDFFDKLSAKAGLGLSRYTASLILFDIILACIFLFKHRPSPQAH